MVEMFDRNGTMAEMKDPPRIVPCDLFVKRALRVAILIVAKLPKIK